MLTSLLLHLTVLYTPLRDYFGTVPLAVADWLLLGVVVAVGVPLLVAVGWLANRVGAIAPPGIGPGPTDASASTGAIGSTGTIESTDTSESTGAGGPTPDAGTSGGDSRTGASAARESDGSSREK